jgi:hypothetical protein
MIEIIKKRGVKEARITELVNRSIILLIHLMPEY